MKKQNNILFFDFFIVIIILGTFTFFNNPKDYSEKEKRYLEKIPRLILFKYWKGVYQNDLEKALSDQIMYSEEIKNNYNKLYDISKWLNLKKLMCGNRYISLGNYRSIFSCKDYIVQDPSYILNENNIDFFTGYNRLNEIVDTYYYLIDTPVIYDFSKNEYSINLTNYFKEHLIGNYTLNTFKFQDFNEYAKYFYKTDHHWNYKGSYKGYTEIMKMFGIEEINKPIATVDFKNIKYYGSHAQQVRYFESYDRFKAYQFNVEKHDTYINGEIGTYSRQSLYLDKEILEDDSILDEKERVEIDMYADFYGKDYKEVIFDFHQEDKDNILIISNSFDNAIDELIASHFNKTYVLDIRHFNQDDFNIEDYLEENSINKVLIVADYYYFYDGIKIRTEWFKDGIQ